MLKCDVLHPEILGVLASAGHGSKVLIGDSNYPFTTGSSPAAEIVYLNFMPGKLTATDVLEGLVRAVPIEAAEVMVPETGPEPDIFKDFRRLLPELELQSLSRYAFYEQAKSPDCCLTIATGEQRIFSNVLITIGVITPPQYV